MKFLSSFLALLLTTAGVALAAKPTADKFQRFHSLSRSRPIELDDTTYNEITSTPRDYHVSILLTALETRFACTLCREFQPEWDLIARSWSKADQPDGIKMLFGTLDFNKGRDTFQKVCGQLSSGGYL